MQVPRQPRIVSLDRLAVGKPASARHIARWNEDTTFLTSFVSQPVISMALQSVSVSHIYNVAYTKTPGTKCLLVTIEAQQATAGTRPRLTCIISCATGTIDYVETGFDLWANGSTRLECPIDTARDYPSFTNTIDVSQLTDGTTYDLKFTIADASGTAGISRGLYRIHVVEVPLADVDPIGNPTTETGVNPAWLTNTDRNAIVDGTDSSLSYGMRRVLNQVAIARAQKYRQFQVVSPESSSLAWNVTANGASPTTAFPFGFGGAPVFRIRPRALYGTSTAATFLLRLRYINSAANKLRFRVAVTPVGGATANTDFLLANSAVFVAKVKDNGGADLTFTVPCTGTNQEADIAFYAVNDTAATTSQVSQIYFREAEA